MKDLDGLYLKGVRVSSSDNISTNYQANDLSRPAALQMSYSESFTVPDTIANRKLNGNAEQLDSGSKWPYLALEAQLISGGEIIFEGIAEPSKYQSGWEMALYEEKRTLYDRLNRSLKTLQLGDYNHTWSLEEINKHANATEGICYPLIDYGLLKDGVLPADAIFPAMFIETIVAQMLAEEGYTLIGDLPKDLLYKSLVMPFTDSEPTNYDQQWADDRSARVSLNIPQDKDEVDRGTLGKGYWLDRLQPFGKDDADDTFYQGKLKSFNLKHNCYICDTAMNLQVQVTQSFKAMTVNGSVEIILSIELNGQKIENTRFESGSYYNILFLRTDTLTLSRTIKCKKGDRITINLEARRQTKLGAFHMLIYNNPESAFASFIPKLSTATGDNWNVPRNLPDISCVQVLVCLAQVFGGTWLVDNRRKQVSFSRLSDIVNNTDNAINWSNRLDTGTQPQWIPRLEPYAQKNLLTWKETDQTKKAGKLIDTKLLNYGDGIISINAPLLDLDVELFNLVFAASTDSEENIPGYGNPVLVKTRTVSGKGDNLTISNQNTAPRLLLVSLDKTQPITVTRLKEDNSMLEKITVNLKPCWFGKRPDTINAPETQFSLSFDKVNINQSEVCLIERHYEGLTRVLRRMRVLTVNMKLKTTDIANLNFSKPIKLERVQVGDLIISTQYFYLNKISGYRKGATCSVTLVAF